MIPGPFYCWRVCFMSNEELIELWDEHRPFIYKIALQYSGYAEMDDLMQEGYLGLYSAAIRFDQNAGASFLTYAAFWIRQRMRRYIENCCSTVRISSGMAARVQKYRKLQSDYQKQFGHKPSADEIRALMGISRSEYDTMQQAVRMGTIASLSAPTGEDDTVTIGDTIGNEGIEDAIIDRIDQEDMKRDVHAAVDKLPDREREVITLRYFEGLTMEQVGELESRSMESVRQCQAKALRLLRSPSYRRPLECYALSDKQLSAAMHNTVSGFNRTWTSATEKAAFIGLAADRVRY
ncbi:sigma-70 family RNA polymerase sigma factor [Coprococcus catus]|nr:sigma-70 family RNA polymerase sigma factor [Coprococcus catus]